MPSLFKPRKNLSFRYKDPMRLDLSENAKKLRKIIDGYLRLVGKELEKDLYTMHGEYINMNLRLNNRGICGFYYNEFCIVIEVPENSTCFFIYTVVHMLDLNEENRERANLMMQRSLELNYLGQGTNGATISLDETSEMLEYTLSFFHEIMCLSYDEFANIVMNFSRTAGQVSDKLDLVEEELQSEDHVSNHPQKRRLTM